MFSNAWAGARADGPMTGKRGSVGFSAPCARQRKSEPGPKGRPFIKDNSGHSTEFSIPAQNGSRRSLLATILLCNDFESVREENWKRFRTTLNHRPTLSGR